MPRQYCYTFGPWNIHTGADPFGPPVRDDPSLAEKIAALKKIGFGGLQIHDDEFIAADAKYRALKRAVKEVQQLLDDHGMVLEFVAPRLWEDPLYRDGGFTSNDPKARKAALARSKRAIDIAKMFGTNLIVIWPAREGTYIREAKDPRLAFQRTLEYHNALLEYDEYVELADEDKPNETMDQAYLPTPGHALALASRTIDPTRVGVNIESAHVILAGLDPSDEMAFALFMGKLWAVHLNDQNGPKFDQDKAFGSVDPRRAFNQVWVLERYGYEGMVGFDVKAMRTTKPEKRYEHLANSKRIFEQLLAVVRSLDPEEIEALRAARDYETLEMLIVDSLMGYN